MVNDGLVLGTSVQSTLSAGHQTVNSSLVETMRVSSSSGRWLMSLYFRNYLICSSAERGQGKRRQPLWRWIREQHWKLDCLSDDQVTNLNFLCLINTTELFTSQWTWSQIHVYTLHFRYKRCPLQVSPRRYIWLSLVALQQLSSLRKVVYNTHMNQSVVD